MSWHLRPRRPLQLLLRLACSQGGGWQLAHAVLQHAPATWEAKPGYRAAAGCWGGGWTGTAAAETVAAETAAAWLLLAAVAAAARLAAECCPGRFARLGQCDVAPRSLQRQMSLLLLQLPG